MRRHASSALLAAAALTLLSACAGGGDGGSAEPADESAASQEGVSAEQWMTENCPATVVKVDTSSVSVKNPPSYALTAGPVTAPQVGDSDPEIRLYSYNQTTNEFSPIRVVEQGERFCFNAEAETRDGYSAPNDSEAEFATVASGEFPDGVWIDSVPEAVPLTENGEPNFDGRGQKSEFYWSTDTVDGSVLSGATETVDYCDIAECV